MSLGKMFCAEWTFSSLHRRTNLFANRKQVRKKVPLPLKFLLSEKGGKGDFAFQWIGQVREVHTNAIACPQLWRCGTIVPEA